MVLGMVGLAIEDARRRRRVSVVRAKGGLRESGCEAAGVGRLKTIK